MRTVTPTPQRVNPSVNLHLINRDQGIAKLNALDYERLTLQDRLNEIDHERKYVQIMYDASMEYLNSVTTAKKSLQLVASK